MDENITDTQFRRIHLFIGEGQIEKALAALDQIQPANQEETQEVAYLRAWCFTEENHWDEAAQFLRDAGLEEEAISDIQGQNQTERRRRAFYQLLMGDIAVNRGHYEEAMRHYRRCIKFLDERRMNIPDVRIRTLVAMGTLSILTGFYDAALTHYEEAFRLCSSNENHPNLPDIYYGLCDMYRQKGNFPRAVECGKEALRLYTERKQQSLVGRMRNLLGRVCYQMRDFTAASTYYTEALALALLDGSSRMAVNNLVALADLRREEGELGEAWRYCDMALDYSTRLTADDAHFLGMMYIVCGKVREAQAEKADGQDGRELREKAISYYQQAIEALKPTNARPVLREAYQHLAQVLEAAGKQDLAIVYWKSAYATSSSSDNPALF